MVPLGAVRTLVGGLNRGHSLQNVRLRALPKSNADQNRQGETRPNLQVYEIQLLQPVYDAAAHGPPHLEIHAMCDCQRLGKSGNISGLEQLYFINLWIWSCFPLAVSVRIFFDKARSLTFCKECPRSSSPTSVLRILCPCSCCGWSL